MRNMKKAGRALAVIMAAALLIGSISGCGKSGGGKDGDNTKNTEQVNELGGGAGDDSTELELWTFVELHQQFYSAMLEKWNAEHKDKQIKLKVNVMPYDDMHNKLQIALNAGEGAPDICDIEISKFPNFTQGTPLLKDLTEEAQPYIGDIVKSRLDIYSKDGKIYGYPTHVGATVAFYNTEVLEEAGVDYTTIKTWDDYKEAGIKVNEMTGKYLGTADTSALWYLNVMLAELHSDYLDGDGNLMVNSPEMIKALTTIKELQDAKAVGTVPGGQPDTEEAYGSFNKGDYACAIMPLWQMSRYTNYMTDLSGKIAIAPVPVFDTAGDVKSVGGGGTGTVVIAGKEKEALASEFLAYAKLSKEANVAIWDTLGFDPCNMSIWEDESVTHNKENTFVKYFQNNPFDVLNSVKTGIAGLKSQTSQKYPSINNTFTTVTLNSIFEEGMDVKEALDQAQEDLKNELE